MPKRYCAPSKEDLEADGVLKLGWRNPKRDVGERKGARRRGLKALCAGRDAIRVADDHEGRADAKPYSIRTHDYRLLTAKRAPAL